MIEVFNEMFIQWKLDTWANVLEIIGFSFASIALIFGFRNKSEITTLKLSHIFDKTINSHIKNLKETANKLNEFLNDYDKNRTQIKSEFGICQTEIDDLRKKLGWGEARKLKRFSNFLGSRKNKSFEKKRELKSHIWAVLIKYPNKLFITTYDDVWIAYNLLIEVIRQMENKVRNKKNSL